MIRICWHKWSNWSRAYKGHEGYKMTQYSVCEKCNAKKSRTFHTDQCISIHDINEATGEEELN